MVYKNIKQTYTTTAIAVNAELVTGGVNDNQDKQIAYRVYKINLIHVIQWRTQRLHVIKQTNNCLFRLEIKWSIFLFCRPTQNNKGQLLSIGRYWVAQYGW